jgi:hypothetical protein
MPKAGLSCGVSGFRNYFGIGRGTIGRDSSHEAKAKVIPVVRMGGPHCGNQWSPYGEQGVSEVSIIERGTTHCDLMWVKQAYIHQYANSNNQPCPYTRFVSWGFDFFVGLNDFVTRRYPAGNTRVLKWPSGELPDPVGAKRTIGADRNGEGQMRGILDEIRVNTHQSRGARIAMTIDGTGIAAGDTEIVLEEDNAWPRNSDNTNANLNWPTTGGLVRIEDELIFYKTSSTGQFEYYADVFARLNNEPPEQNKADRRWVNPCTKAHELHPNIKRKQGVRLTNVMRGVLGTEPKDHPPGAQALLLDGMAVTLLTGAFHREADSFRLANGRGFPKEGYAWFGGTSGSGGEVVSYLEYQGAAGPGTRGGAAGAAQGGSFTGCKHFRGRFGTQMADHDVDTIVRCMPFRYWDREAKLYDGEGLAYIQCGYAATNAVWDGVEMVIGGTEDLPTPNAVLPRVLVRFDNNPGWDQEPLNRDGGLFELNRRTGPMRLPNVRADQIELRVYWEFRRGAFLPNSDWKRTFSIEKLRATYHTPLVMRRLDEVEKR